MPTKTLYKPSASAAAKRASAALDLDDLTRLGTALAEVAADEVARNRAFAAQVRAIYESIPPSAKRVKSDPTRALTVDLVPRKQYEGHRIDPTRPLDPYFILDAYGLDQLATALDLFSLKRLKEGSVLVEKRNPGTKPSSRGQKAAIIDYIVGQLTAL